MVKMKNEKQAKWLTDRVQTIRGLKSPNEPQRLLVILHDKADKTAQEIKTLSLLVDSQTGKPVDDPAKLLGALVSLHELSRDNPKWEEWKLKGQVLLNQKKED